MKQCTRCASEISEKSKVCPRCGLPVEKMHFEEEENHVQNVKLNAAQKREKKRLAKLEKKAKEKEKKAAQKRSDTDFTKLAVNAPKEEDAANEVPMSKRKRLKKEREKPIFELDDKGQINIDTKDVELVGEEVGKIIEERNMQTYSVKKARGEYREPKIKWWEIYKFADRAMARRKIKKEVSKAAKIKPSFVSKPKLLCLAIFLGWCGAHNFYAGNKKKGWVSVVSLILWVGVVYLAGFSSFFASIQFSIGGGAGFVCLAIWLSDIINIIFNSFKYRIQKEEFIFSMNVETRAKLGEKYVDIDLYQKPWWVRFKVWCQKKKRNYQEWKHERRQRLIEREKARLAAEEKAKTENAETNETEKKSRQNIEEQIKAANVLGDLDKYEGAESSSEPVKTSKQKKAKVVQTKKAKVVQKKKTNSKK